MMITVKSHQMLEGENGETEGHGHCPCWTVREKLTGNSKTV